MVEWTKYSPYGIPFGLPGADTDSDGDCDATDITQIQTWIDGSSYDVRGDVDLDGDVDSTDKSIAQSNYQGTTSGWNDLTAIGNRTGYAGYEWDGVVSMYHVRHRVLNPVLGRWTRRDPLGFTGGLNMYTYSAGVIWRNDPMGLLSNSQAYTCSACYIEFNTEPLKCSSGKCSNPATGGGALTRLTSEWDCQADCEDRWPDDPAKQNACKGGCDVGGGSHTCSAGCTELYESGSESWSACVMSCRRVRKGGEVDYGTCDINKTNCEANCESQVSQCKSEEGDQIIMGASGGVIGVTGGILLFCGPPGWIIGGCLAAGGIIIECSIPVVNTQQNKDCDACGDRCNNYCNCQYEVCIGERASDSCKFRAGCGLTKPPFWTIALWHNAEIPQIGRALSAATGQGVDLSWNLRCCRIIHIGCHQGGAIVAVLRTKPYHHIALSFESLKSSHASYACTHSATTPIGRSILMNCFIFTCRCVRVWSTVSVLAQDSRCNSSISRNR
ncbi:MAG: RHS repeat-associated core domain-containing protein [Planctomycetes bacterium]|nr:RHS repeat-associated core domain-containing protein [Planctomycetota bacterium]